jgi:O-acetyl-ADP-ribose deacetylase (regulator of RNase III)
MATSRMSWTNSSVKTFAGADDPMAIVVSKARQITFDALEAGWSGPPFDPIQLAEHLGLTVVPKDDIADARILKQPDGQMTIEYNPNRPRGRVRYSIAHEIAHTFFPDYADKVRNRDEKSDISGDDWQLEMLCNIGAAELIMPIGSFPDLRGESISIDKLMELRKQYDVSTEALLLRFIRLTDRACCLFAASRVEDGTYAGRYRIDYAVPSRHWKHSLPGPHLPDGTLLEDCSAIGFTAKGTERWPPDNESLRVEAVGVPSYPGSVHARVLGLVFVEDALIPSSSIKYVVGDATEPRGQRPHIIVQVMNDSSATWGGGFSKALAIKFSAAQIDYRAWASDPENKKLGRVHFYGDAAGVTLATIVAQRGIGASETARIRYPALHNGLQEVTKQALETSASVHMPRIGCGIAGGKWEVVSELVEQTLIASGVSVTVYDPGTKVRARA